MNLYLCTQPSRVNYLDYFVRNDLSKEEILDVYVDRGICNFDAFVNCLNERVPNLKKINIEQNYSWSKHLSSMDMYQAFLRFLNLLSVEELRFFDIQSGFVKHFTIDDVFNSMNDNIKSIIFEFNCDAPDDEDNIDENISVKRETRNGKTVTVYSIINEYNYDDDDDDDESEY